MGDLIKRLQEEADTHRIGFCEPETAALLREAAAALEAAREDACVTLVADIRFACGDNGKRMQSELVEFIRKMAADAERWSELCRQIDADEIPGGIFEDAKHMGAGALEMHIDDAREARNG